MKLIACTLPLLAGLPSVLSAQVRIWDCQRNLCQVLLVCATFIGRNTWHRTAELGTRQVRVGVLGWPCRAQYDSTAVTGKIRV